VLLVVCTFPIHLTFYSIIFITLGESSSGSNYSADERKRINIEQRKYEVRAKLCKATGEPLPSPPNDSDCGSTISASPMKTRNRILHSPLPDSSLPPSSPDLNTVSPHNEPRSQRAHPPPEPHPSHSPSPIGPTHPASPPRLTAAQKGKARQRSPKQYEGVDANADPTQAPATAQKKRGPMPKVAWDKARGLAQELMVSADQLAKEFGRSRRDILIAAGLGITMSHKKRNDANTYRSWYWNTQDIPTGS
jgi:hypothetical protein